MKRLFYILFLYLFLASCHYHQPSSMPVQPTVAQQAMIDRKYGMFITFGLNTYLDLEWSDGSHAATNYSPPADLTEKAEEWVKVAKEAGMRSVLLTTKHHDGFCLWDSEYTEHDIANPGISHKIDLVRAVSDACRKYGLSFTVYYSLWDRREPTYKDPDKHVYIEFMKNQLKELFTQYGTVGELWFDGAWDRKVEDWYLPEIYDFVKRLQPECQISTNWTVGKRPIDMREGDTILYYPADFRLWDPHLPVENDPKIYTYKGKEYYLPFESTQTISILGNWYYHDTDTMIRDLDELKDIFYRTTTNDNCLLLNVPPDKEGNMNPVAIQRINDLARYFSIDNGKPFPQKMQKPQSLVFLAQAQASSIYKNDTLHFGSSLAIDGDVSTAWICNERKGWFVFDFGKQISFNELSIIEGNNNIKRFCIEIKQNGKWVIIYEGKELSNENIRSFMGYGYGQICFSTPIMARKIRFSILESKDLPSIYSFRVK